MTRAEMRQELLRRIEHAARAGRPAPTNDDICAWFSFASAASASALVRRCEQEGQIRVHRGPMCRVIEAADGRWRTAGEIPDPHFSRARMRSGADWSDADVQRLREMAAAGLSWSAIAREMNVTKNAVIGKAHRLGLAKAPAPAPQRAETAVARAPAPRLVPPSSPRYVAPARPPAAPPPVRALASPHRRCQWIESEAGQPVRMCGAPVARPGCSWCARHHARVFVPPGAMPSRLGWLV